MVAAYVADAASRSAAVSCLFVASHLALAAQIADALYLVAVPYYDVA